MKKLNSNNLLNKNCLFFLSHCILFFCLQLKLCFAQTNDFNKEVSSNNVNAEIKVSKLTKPSLGSLGIKTELNNLMGLNIWQDLKAEEIARKSIKVASDICVFTNNNITVEKV